MPMQLGERIANINQHYCIDLVRSELDVAKYNLACLVISDRAEQASYFQSCHW